MTKPKGNESQLFQKTLTLTSLAILKVDIDEQFRTYTDYLITFVLCVLTTHKPDVVTDSVVADLLEQEFGLRVPVKAVQHALRRMVRKDYLRKENEAFFPGIKLPHVDISAKRRTAANQIQRVYGALCQFAGKVQPGLVWTDPDAASAILGFLGRFVVDCLKTYVFNTALPQVRKSDPKELYIVSRFLQEAYERDRPLFEDFIVLVKGQMYANALTCPDLQSLQQKFDRITFYIDTPLALNLLGLQGKDAKHAAEELVTLIRDLNGSLALFGHTADETNAVIHYVIENFDNPQGDNRILREIRSSGASLSELILCMDQLEERMAIFHVRVKPTPKYDSDFQIGESAFESALEEEIRYQGRHALQHDINSVRSIYALRHGFEPTRLEDAVAALVTTNSAFAKVAFEFGKTHNSSREISSVITDYSLANVAWLKAPMKRPSLPEKETLALCYAALEPGKELFQKYVETMDRLKENGQISEADHAILRLSPLAHRELMNFTLGDEQALTGSGLRQILNRVKESLVKEEKKRAAEQLTAITQIHMKREQDLQITLDQQQILRELSEQERDGLKQDQTKILLTASKRAKSLSRLIIISVMAVFSCILLLGAAGGSGLFTTQSKLPKIFKVLITVSVFIAVVWCWYSWITGKTVRVLTKQFEHRLTLKFSSWLTGKVTSSEL
jgi:hypothetical protein